MVLPANKESSHSTVRDVETRSGLPEEPSRILAEVTGADGHVARSMATMPAGYMPTVASAIEVASRVLEGLYKTGFQSPASVYGEQLLQSLQVEIIDL